jgi:NADPH-dependent curcumin reductase CurA
LVAGYCGWQDCALSNGQGLTASAREDPHPSRAFGVLGMPGFTAYMGLLDIGQPVAGETVVVAAASGAVFDAVLPLLNAKARMPLCGLVSGYNATPLPTGPDRLGRLQGKNFGKLVIQLAHE